MQQLQDKKTLDAVKQHVTHLGNMTASRMQFLSHA